MESKEIRIPEELAGNKEFIEKFEILGDKGKLLYLKLSEAYRETDFRDDDGRKYVCLRGSTYLFKKLSEAGLIERKVISNPHGNGGSIARTYLTDYLPEKPSRVRTAERQLEILEAKKKRIIEKEKRLKAKYSAEERKKRIKRLIEVGAAVEDVLGKPIYKEDLPKLILYLEDAKNSGNFFSM